MEEDNYKCPRCGSKLVLSNSFRTNNVHGYEVWQCVREGCNFTFQRSMDEPQQEPERNFFADCSNTESLAWQYIGWTGAILNDSLFKNDNRVLSDLKEALEHFKKRWGEILNETK